MMAHTTRQAAKNCDANVCCVVQNCEARVCSCSAAVLLSGMCQVAAEAININFSFSTLN